MIGQVSQRFSNQDVSPPIKPPGINWEEFEKTIIDIFLKAVRNALLNPTCREMLSGQAGDALKIFDQLNQDRNRNFTIQDTLKTTGRADNAVTVTKNSDTASGLGKGKNAKIILDSSMVRSGKFSSAGLGNSDFWTAGTVILLQEIGHATKSITYDHDVMGGKPTGDKGLPTNTNSKIKNVCLGGSKK